MINYKQQFQYLRYELRQESPDQEVIKYWVDHIETSMDAMALENQDLKDRMVRIKANGDKLVGQLKAIQSLLGHMS